MAYQFVHVNTYSIKSGGSGIAAEAGRKPDHSQHVENPQPPVLLAGVEPELAWSMIEDRHSKARDLVTLKKSGRKAERRLRSDASVLLAAVASYPGRTEASDTENPDFQDWLQRSIAWLTEQHGEPLSVVLHLDETHPHIHFLTAPDLEDGQRMADIHPGEQAKAEIGGKKAGRIEKRQAFTEAMRQYQDGYHEAVGLHHGQARLGPKRQRLSRDEWKAQQAELQRQAERQRQLESQTEAVTSASVQLDQREAAAAAAQEAIEKANAELAAKQTEIAEREAATAEALAKIDTMKADLEAREQSVWETEVEVSELKEQLVEREQTVAKAQAKVVEAQGELVERGATQAKAEAEVKDTKEILKNYRTDLENFDGQLTEKIEEVTDQERRLAGFWGAIVSAVTLGRAGTKKRVDDAVKAVRADFDAELGKTTAEAENAARAHESAIKKLERENSKLKKQNVSFAKKFGSLEKIQREASSQAQELGSKLQAVESDNEHLSAARDNLATLVDDLEDAISAGDLALAQDLFAEAGPGSSLRAN